MPVTQLMAATQSQTPPQALRGVPSQEVIERAQRSPLSNHRALYLVRDTRPIPHVLHQAGESIASVRPESIVTTVDDGGQLRAMLNDSTWIGAEATLPVYNGTAGESVAFGTPPTPNPTPSAPATPGPNGFNALYAPTLHVQNLCLEVGIEYFNYYNAPTTLEDLYVFDACSSTNQWPVQESLAQNSNFVNTYNIDYQDPSIPAQFLVAEIVEPASVTGTTAYTVAVIWNPQVNSDIGEWDNLASSSGDNTQSPPSPFNDPGWLMFETHYDPDPCADIPTMVATSPYYFTAYTSASPSPSPLPSQSYSYPFPWAAETATNQTTSAWTEGESSTPYIECLQDDGSGMGYYYEFLLFTQGEWAIYSDPSSS